jgi:hypothetical protein
MEPQASSDIERLRQNLQTYYEGIRAHLGPKSALDSLEAAAVVMNEDPLVSEAAKRVYLTTLDDIRGELTPPGRSARGHDEFRLATAAGAHRPKRESEWRRKTATRRTRR